MLGNVWFPVTGGLFLGSDASVVVTEVGRHFPNTQDQRNAARGRVRYEITPRIWIGGGDSVRFGVAV
jgi:hypothetical protein